MKSDILLLTNSSEKELVIRDSISTDYEVYCVTTRI